MDTNTSSDMAIIAAHQASVHWISRAGSAVTREHAILNKLASAVNINTKLGVAVQVHLGMRPQMAITSSIYSLVTDG